MTNIVCEKRYERSDLSVSRIVELFGKRRFNTHPVYQRNDAFGIKEKSYLILSILENIPIPEIMTHVEKINDGIKSYEVVDGKQRMEGVIAFIQNKFPLKLPKTEYHNKYFKDLSQPNREKIMEYRFGIIELYGHSLYERANLFVRMSSNSKPLTGQEQLNAKGFDSEFTKLTHKILTLPYWRRNGIFDEKSSRRMLDIKTIQQWMCAMNGNYANRQVTRNNATMQYRTTFPDADKMFLNFVKTWELTEELLGEFKTTYYRKSSILVGLFIALSEVGDKIKTNQKRLLSQELLQFGKLLGDYTSGAKIYEAEKEGKVVPDLVKEFRAYNNDKQGSADVRGRQVINVFLKIIKPYLKA